MSIPRATARLQFHRDFTLDDACEVVDYFSELGISHIYASPLLTARSGSTHGYDIVDPTRINPELGGIAALRRFVASLRAADMGLILDIVPNHMGVSPENPWWQHLLEWGRNSPYAGWFDIDWQSADAALRGKVLAPFLGQPYGDALASGDIQLHFDADAGRIYVGYFSHRFPISPPCYATILQSARQEEKVEHAECLALSLAAFEQIASADSPHIQQERAEAAFLLLRECAHTVEGAAAIARALQTFAISATNGLSQLPQLQALHALLERQHYRLAWWRNAAEEINWRRFFEVSDLIGVRVEQDSVFDATHALIFQLYAEGLIDGVRIDHVDGLADPTGYCRKLRQGLAALNQERARAILALQAGHISDPGRASQSEQAVLNFGPDIPDAGPYIIVEKILAAGEQLRADWGVDGSTGYDFMDQVGALLHDPAGAVPLAELRAELGVADTDFEREVQAARRQILAENLVGEFDTTARVLHAIARADLRTRDFSLAAIRRAFAELLVTFPVYRTYAGEEGRDAHDQQVFEQAATLARKNIRPADWPVLEVIGNWLGGMAPPTHENTEVRNLCRRAITRFQQLTPPLAAKSVEDTAFYRYGRLLSRNEVGADPGQFSLSAAAFHAACAERGRLFPHALLTTATHDHKRGEDLRARLAVLSEIPQQWAATVRHWMLLNAPLRTALTVSDMASDDGEQQALNTPNAPQADDELMLYQMLVGAWPPALDLTDRNGVLAFAERIDQWQTKALREAKSASSWVQPNEEYEVACRDFLFGLLDPDADNRFLPELLAWVQRIAAAGAINSLTQTVLRLTAPGVPDLYQGTEFWDFSLVDPDNRRPVDYAARRNALSATAPLMRFDWSGGWQSGALKQHLIHRALQLRARLPQLFSGGDYLPLAVEGPLSHHVIAFMRRDREHTVIVLATLFPAHMAGAANKPSLADVAWQNTRVVLPADAAGMNRRWKNILCGVDSIVAGDAGLLIAEILNDLPIAVLEGDAGV